MGCLACALRDPRWVDYIMKTRKLYGCIADGAFLTRLFHLLWSIMCSDVNIAALWIVRTNALSQSSLN